MDLVLTIRSVKAAWAVAKKADVAEKVRTTVIMARKSWGEMGIVSIGVAEVLGLAESTRTRGIGDSDDAGSGPVAVGTVDAGMWGSSAGAAGGGWSSTGSLGGRGGAPGTNCHFSIVKIASHTRRALNRVHPKNQGAPSGLDLWYFSSGHLLLRHQ